MTGKKRAGKLALLVAVLALAACSNNKPPSSVTDACRMKSERPHWFDAMERTEAKWGIPVSVQMATIAREFELRA